MGQLQNVVLMLIVLLVVLEIVLEIIHVHLLELVHRFVIPKVIYVDHILVQTVERVIVMGI